ncbi:MAG TPA: Na/Pi cotransporter [Lachnospiraceae bacterium]|nr:Na/Pi cotransporter [Lachnospiraceae bacterium]
MDIFSVLSLIGGLSLFLFGMTVMGVALEKQAGGKLKRILEKLTSSPIKGLFLGLGVTAVIQSSSATTVMVVGFVNSGLMTLRQAIGIIMGANIGTTVTAWILSLTALESGSFIIQLMKPSAFAPVLAAIGIGFYMFSKSDKKKNIGTIFLGFTVLMTGMEIMTAAVKPLAAVPEFTHMLLMFSNPIFGVLAGALLTAAIQSSSASVGILQALSQTGAITFGSAIPIIMGQNIGTCVTALLAGVGAGKNAKRASMVHLYFNIIGTIIFLLGFYGLKAIIGFSFINDPLNAANIAVIHTLFNLTTTAVMLPFTKGLEKLACLTVKDDAEDEEFQMLDDRLFATPSVAVYHCKTITDKMALLAKKTLFDAIECISDYKPQLGISIVENEDKIDVYEDKLGTYLVKLSSKDLSAEDSNETSKLLHCIGDFERIGDHALNIKETADEINQKNIIFSDDAIADIKVISSALREILDMSIEVFINNDVELATKVEPLEQVIDLLKSSLKTKHIERLQKGGCTTEMGFVFSDLITNYERVADHCSNVAVCVIEIAKNSFSTHEYINELKESHNKYFEGQYEAFKAKYSIK